MFNRDEHMHRRYESLAVAQNWSIQVKYAFLHVLYPVPNVFVTVDGAIVVARALRAGRDDVVCVLCGAVLRITVVVDVLRAVFDGVDELRATIAERTDLSDWVVAVPRPVVDVVRVTVRLPISRVTELVVRRVATLADVGVGVRDVRAITVWVVVVAELSVDVRLTVFSPRTAASAFAMPIKHATTKNIIFFIPFCIYYK